MRNLDQVFDFLDKQLHDMQIRNAMYNAEKLEMNYSELFEAIENRLEDSDEEDTKDLDEMYELINQAHSIHLKYSARLLNKVKNQ